jgi:hypothetical protein
MLRPRATSAGCAINQPVRERRTQTQPETNQLDVTGIFCGKLSPCPVRAAMERAASEEIRTNTEFVSSIHRQAARQYDRVAKRASIISFGKTRGNIARHADERTICASAACSDAVHDALSSRKPVPKMKDPSGGTTGRVKPYGRLGWMGARAVYSRWGGITAPT